MEENKKEVVQEVKVEKEYYTKEEVNDLVNAKISTIFGDLVKEINKPKEKEKEQPRELTEEELKF